jgi:Zn-dependent protease
VLTIGEPNRTPYDLNFGLLGFPIRIHPLFWLAALIWGFRPDVDGISIMIWVTVMLVSILAHELGHALMMRNLGRHARVVLHFMGGLAIEDDERSPWALSYGRKGRTPQEQIWISIAGPVAGFLLAGLVWGAVLATGGSVGVHFSWETVPYCHAVLGGDLARNIYLNQFVGDMLYINIFWGVVNLFPVIPLDGGQIAQAWLTAQDPANGVVKALWLSVFAGAAAAVVFGILLHEMFLLLLFASLAFSCYMTLQQFQGRGPRGW